MAVDDAHKQRWTWSRARSSDSTNTLYHIVAWRMALAGRHLWEGRKSKRDAQLALPWWEDHGESPPPPCDAPWPPPARSSPPAAHRSRRMVHLLGTLAVLLPIHGGAHLAAWPAGFCRHHGDSQRYPHRARYLTFVPCAL